MIRLALYDYTRGFLYSNFFYYYQMSYENEQQCILDLWTDQFDDEAE